MREILFRGKRVSNGEWVEGSLIKAKAENNKDVLYLIAPFTMSAFDVEEVIPETVGEYTGLTDKNGTKIFEGDVVKIGSEIIKWKCYHKVVFEEGQWFYLHEEISTKSYMGAWGSSCVEVIGNIHDNPELLGDK